jgi:hypothetical protein
MKRLASKQLQPIPNYLTKIAEQYGIKSLYRETTYVDCNQGACAGDEIMLGEFDDEDKEIIAFFHELAHCTFNDHVKELLSIEKLPLKMSFLSNEGLCWEYAFCLAAKHGYTWELDSPIYEYAFNCLVTYVCHEYDRVGRRGDVYKKEENYIKEQFKLLNKGY